MVSVLVMVIIAIVLEGVEDNDDFRLETSFATAYGCCHIGHAVFATISWSDGKRYSTWSHANRTDTTGLALSTTLTYHRVD